MVLRKSENKYDIFIETYIGAPTLQSNTHPIVTNENYDRLYGLIKKVKDLDPVISNQFIYTDNDIISKRFSEPNKMKELLEEYHIGVKDDIIINTNDKQHFPIFSIENYINDPLIKKYDEDSMNIMNIYKNRGLMIKPLISFDKISDNGTTFDITDNYKNQLINSGFLQTNSNQLTKDDMGLINACKYKLDNGLTINTSTYQDFLRITKLKPENEDESTRYKRVFDFLKTTYLDKIQDPTQVLYLDDEIDKLITIQSDKKEEEKRIKLLTSLINKTEEEVKEMSVDLNKEKKNIERLKQLEKENKILEEGSNDKEGIIHHEREMNEYLEKTAETKKQREGFKGQATQIYNQKIKPKKKQINKNINEMNEIFKDLKTFKFKRIIEDINLNYNEIAKTNRARACNIVKALRNVNDNKGLHNRVKNESTTSIPSYTQLMNMIKIASSEQEDLDYCEFEGDDCPKLNQNIGIKEPDRKEVGIMDTSSTVYMYANVPIDVINRTNKLKEKTSMFQYFIKAVNDANVNFDDSINNIDSFEKLQWLGKLINMPFIDRKIPYQIDIPEEIQKMSWDIAKGDKSKEDYYNFQYSQFIEDYEQNNYMENISKLSSDPSKKPLSYFKKAFLTHEINENDYLKGEILNENNKCVNTKIKIGSRKQKFNPKLILLDGDGNLIKYKKENGDRLKIEEVIKIIEEEYEQQKIKEISMLDKKSDNYNEKKQLIEKKYNPNKATDVRNWYWTCIAQNNDMEDENYLSKEDSIPYTISTINQNRKFDLYNLAKNQNSSNTVKDNIIKNSLADVLSDVAIILHNVINIGNMTQINDYVENNDWNILSELNPKSYKTQLKDRIPEFDKINKKIKSNMEIFNLEKEYKIIEELAKNEYYSFPSIIRNGVLLNDEQNFILEKRKMVANNQELFIPKPFNYDYLTNNMEERKEISENAPLAVITNLNDIFNKLK